MLWTPTWIVGCKPFHYSSEQDHQYVLRKKYINRSFPQLNNSLFRISGIWLVVIHNDVVVACMFGLVVFVLVVSPFSNWVISFDGFRCVSIDLYLIGVPGFQIFSGFLCIIFWCFIRRAHIYSYSLALIWANLCRIVK